MPPAPTTDPLTRRDRKALERAEYIRRRFAGGETVTELAAAFSLSKGTVSRIVRGLKCARAAGPTARVGRNQGPHALSAHVVRELRHAAAGGQSTAALATRHGLSVKAVQKLLRGALRPDAGGPLAAPPARLPAHQVATIRRRYADGESQRALAAQFGLSRSAVGAIVRGETYPEAPGPVAHGPNPQTRWLTAAEVRAIREAYAGGASVTELARHYGKQPASIGHAVAGRTYRDAGGPMGEVARAAHRRARS